MIAHCTRSCARIAPRLGGARLEKMRSSRGEIIFPAECTLWNSTVTPVEKGDCTLNRLSRADPDRREAKFQFRPLNELRFRNRFRATIRQLLFRRRTRESSLSRGKTRVQIPYLRFFTANEHFQRFTSSGFFALNRRYLIISFTRRTKNHRAFVEDP